MIRRIATIVVVLALVVGAGLLLFASGPKPPRYTLIFDNAFGVTEGALMKSAGVEIGEIKKFDVVRRGAKAKVTVEITRPKYNDLRKDVTCAIEPQSLIGEYFINCDPGQSSEKLEEGSTIGLSQTRATIPPDLVLNIMRQPQREQLGLILSEFGAGVAARGPELDATIKRAIPALTEVDKVLRILADNRKTLVNLTVQSDRVLGELSDNRTELSRFVREAGDAAAISAREQDDLRATIRRLPPFLREARPTLRQLGTVSEELTPALADLRRSAPDLERLLGRLGPFARASRPALESLGDASRVGTQAVREAEDTIERLASLGGQAQEPATNLRFVLEHADDRQFAVERNPVSPGGAGFTGLEALLQYVFVQPQAINLFDSRGYFLKLNILINECSQYTDAQTAREDRDRTARCSQALGPNQPGINDGTPGGGSPRASSAASRDRDRDRDDGAGSTRAADDQAGPSGTPERAERGGDAGARAQEPSGDRGGLLDHLLPKAAAEQAGEAAEGTAQDAAGKVGSSLQQAAQRELGRQALEQRSEQSGAAVGQAQDNLLNYLLGP